MEGESAILVRVEESHETVGLRLRRGVVALVTEEVEDFEGGDARGAISVESLESRVGSEVADVTEALTGALQGHLTVSDGDEQIFQSAFRFKSKAHIL